ncbi:MAG TPA: aerotolerance regulator BatA [Candidatus Omnitrophica bacterium]|nr:aerotolerance regulator BatA [Candidatus Omnitrophota bacterium]
MLFKDPWILLLIPLVILWVYWTNSGREVKGFRFPSLQMVRGLETSLKCRLSRYLWLARACVLILFLLGLARPQSPLEETKRATEGIDIVLTVDASGSMAAEDFELEGRRTNRLKVVKDVVADFVRMRSSDRVGMVAFGGRAYTVCPLTLDYDWLLTNLERVELGVLEDGTAIGSAIVSSLTRLKGTKAKSKIIILLTDGMNNAGQVDPLKAAKAAQALGVKIYTIGAGTRGLAPFPMQDFFGRTVYQNVKIDLDEELLNQIASVTGGTYYRATDTTSLRRIYEEIDKLEKTKIEESGYREYKELFPLLVLCALGLLVLGIILENTILLRIP